MTSGALVAIFRCLNLVTFQDKYLLPNRLDFLARIAGCTVSSKIDLSKGYHEMVVNPEDVQKTFIIRPLGLLNTNGRRFCLRNAGNTFQQHIDTYCRYWTWTLPFPTRMPLDWLPNTWLVTFPILKRSSPAFNTVGWSFTRGNVNL
jgi:hypothetical protein